MTRYGIDYSTPRPRPDAVRAAGKTFVCRYLATLPNPKVLTVSQVSALHAAGLGIVVNWEQASDAMRQGYSLGLVHAQRALAQCRVLGVPDSVPVYFSCDFDVSPSEMSGVKDYLRACVATLGFSRVGVYGKYSVIEACVPTYAAYGWQTYAWSGGRVSDKAHLYQYQNGVQVAGVDCDLDRSLKDHFGAWEAQTVELEDVVWTSKPDNNGHLPGDVPAGDRSIRNILGSIDQRTSLLTNGGMIDDIEESIKTVGTSVGGVATDVKTLLSRPYKLSDADVLAIATKVAALLKGQ